ncbi:MAG: hypothetical protein ABFC96_04135 [Thermoguttaceae bacterium]
MSNIHAVVEKTGVDGLLAGVTIGQHAKALQRRGIPVSRLGAAEWIQVFDLYTGGRIPREAISAVAARMAEDTLDAEGACKALEIDLQQPDLWSKEAQRVALDGYRRTKDDSPERQARFLVGQAVHMLKGKAPAAEVAEFVKAKLGK